MSALAGWAAAAEVAALSDEAFAERILAAGRTPTPPLCPAHAGTLEVARSVVAGRFTLIGETYDLGDDPSWTRNPSRDKEWLIAHHKFVWAPDLLHAHRATGDPAYVAAWARLVGSWLEEMGTGFIAQSDAQVEAKRAEHWLASLDLLRGCAWRGAVDPALIRALVCRLGDEAVYISAHLKPVRNHRTFELLSVFLVGALLPELLEADALRGHASALLRENLLAEIHPDGVHVELSTHYHQLVCEAAMAYAETSAAIGRPIAADLRERLARALRFSLWFQWPDGSIPLLGDSDAGDHRALLARGAALWGDAALRFGATLGATGAPPQRPAAGFDSSGYAVLRDRWGHDAADEAQRTHVVYDAALLGDGSHSHYDLFSFTLHCAGGPAIVDPGRFTYSSDPDADGVDWRHHFKATAAHNTVCIDGRDQTRYLSRTKHGPDVTLADRAWALGGDTDWIRARAHSAEYAPVHERLLLFVQRSLLIVVDRLDPVDGAAHDYDLRFHLPAAEQDRVDCTAGDGQLMARSARFELRSALEPGDAAGVQEGWVSRRYGVRHAAPVLHVARTTDAPAAFCTAIAPHGSARLHRVERLAAQDGTALSFRVTHDAGRDTVLVGTGEADGVAARGGFVIVRRDPAGRVVAAAGQRVERLVVDGCALRGPGPPADLVWPA